MLFVEGWKFLLDIMRVCPLLESKHLHIFYAYIPPVGRKIEDIVTEKVFATKALYYIADIYDVNNDPCQSSKQKFS